MTASSRPGETGPSDDQRRTGRGSTFLRGEQPLAHTVYGLILALATIGELIHHEVSAATSVVWLLGASAVLLGAHLFSDLLAHVATTREDPDWSEIVSVNREDISVVYGGVGAAAIMAAAAIGDLNSGNALVVSVATGLGAIAALCFHGLSHHRLLPRLIMTSVGVGFGAVIVLLENTV